MDASDSDLSLGSSSASPASDADRCETLDAALRAFAHNATVPSLSAHAHAACRAFNQALAEGSPVAMLPNYSIRPSGREAGDYLVVDLGGSTLRVAVISIAPPGAPRADRIRVVVSRKWTVANSRKCVDHAFFVWIGSKVRDVLASQTTITTAAVITTGVSWSFPLASTSYNSGKIFHMAKGYEVHSDISGASLKTLFESVLRDSFALRIDVQAIVNDSLAVYAAGSFLDANTRLGLVLGTGLNFCCQLDSSAKLAANKRLPGESHVLFNTETSLFGAHLIAPLATKYDAAIDARFRDLPRFLPHMELDPSTNSIFQPFELLASGRYLPELVRLVLVEMIERREIFVAQKNFSYVNSRYEGFTGELMCFISECDDSALVAAKVEECFGWRPLSVALGDVISLKLLVAAVVRRSAFIVAVAIIAYLKLLSEHNGRFDTGVVTIGYVGSVMEYFHKLRAMTLDFVNNSTDAAALGVQVKLQPVNESSLVGAAIAAASRVDKMGDPGSRRPA